MLQKIEDYKNKIICGDALTVLKSLPDKFIDVGVTSPPYNKGEDKKGWLVANVKYNASSDKLPEVIYQERQVAVLDEIFRITKDGGSFFYNHKIRWEQGKLLHPMDWLRRTKWLIRQEIIWDRMIAANIRGWRFWQVDERVYWLYKPKGNHLIGEELESMHALLTSIWRFPPEKENPHPAPFPLALPIRCIYSTVSSKENVLILDPYCGSGTTLVAAKILGYDYIGIDISKDYCQFAEERIKNFRNEEIIAQEEIAKHIVVKTFKERKQKGEFTGKYGKNRNINKQSNLVFK